MFSWFQSFLLSSKCNLYRYELAQIIAQWFDNEGKELKEMCVKAKLLGRPDATFNIVRELADMANRA